MSEHMLTNGDYRTASGSTVRISGKHAGIHDIVFDWFEEGACCEAAPSVDVYRGTLDWQCDCHDSGQADLSPIRSVEGGTTGPVQHE